MIFLTYIFRFLYYASFLNLELSSSFILSTIKSSRVNISFTLRILNTIPWLIIIKSRSTVHSIFSELPRINLYMVAIAPKKHSFAHVQMALPTVPKLTTFYRKNLKRQTINIILCIQVHQDTYTSTAGSTFKGILEGSCTPNAPFLKCSKWKYLKTNELAPT